MSKCQTISSYIVKHNLEGMLPPYLHRPSEFMVRICRIFQEFGLVAPPVARLPITGQVRRSLLPC